MYFLEHHDKYIQIVLHSILFNFKASTMHKTNVTLYSTAKAKGEAVQHIL